jgi:hypothetical protein
MGQLDALMGRACALVPDGKRRHDAFLQEKRMLDALTTTKRRGSNTKCNDKLWATAWGNQMR